MKQLMAPERGDHDRSIAPHPQDADAGIDLGDVVEHARAQAQPPPRGDVVSDGDLVIGPRRRKGVGGRREPGAGFLLERVEISAVQSVLLVPDSIHRG
jgi:hypothetical protein